MTKKKTSTPTQSEDKLYREEILLERIKQASDTISHLNSAVTVFGLLLTVFGIIIPILGYFFVIKPQDELRSLIDDNIQSYMDENRKNRIEQAIEDIQNSDRLIRLRGLNTLELQQPLELNDLQIFQLIQIIEKKDGMLHNTLPPLLLYQNSKLVHDFFKGELLKEKSELEGIALKYFIRSPENDLNDILDFFDEIIDKEYVYFKLINTAYRDKEMFLKILNSKRLIDELFKSLSIESRKAEKIKSKLGFNPDNIKDTYFAKKFGF